MADRRVAAGRRTARPAGRPTASRAGTRSPASRTAAAAPSRVVLTGVGGVLLIFFLTVAGATLDVLISSRLGAGALIALCLSSALGAWLVRRSDLLSVMVAPPLVYVVVAALSVLMRNAPLTAPGVVSWLAIGFPAMAAATGLTLLIGGGRILFSRD